MRQVFSLLVALLLFSLNSMAQQKLYAITGSSGAASTLYELNPANGAVVANIGSTGYSHIVAMAIDPTSGIMYGFVNNGSFLVTIDMTTGAATPVSGVTHPFHISDMTFSSSGVLYGWAEPGQDDIYIINKVTGGATLLGNCACGTAQTGLGMNSSGQLYMKSAGSIHQMNTTTGAIMTSAFFPGGTHNMLTFDENDVAFTGQRSGAGFILKTINPVTGALTTIGGNPVTNIGALAFSACSAPSFTTCPGNITATNDAGNCGAVVSYTADASNSPTYSYSFSGATSGSGAGTGTGSIFSVGTTTVTVTATNTCGSATCSFDVAVTDNELPTITAPADVTVENYCEPAPADLGTPTASDNCAYTVTNDAPPLFPVGSTTVTWTVTDASGNFATATQTVTVNPVTLSITGTATDVSCNGGSNGAVDITVNNGTAPYGYNWSNGATTEDISGLSAGTYSVSVMDDHSCTGSSSFTVSEPTPVSGSITVNPNPTVTGQAQNTIFLGYGPQSVTLTAAGAGGTPGYSYNWSTGATTASITVSPTTTTTYTVTIMDANGCSTTVSQTITVIDIRSANNKVYICHNGNTISISVNAVPAHLAHGDILGPCITARFAQSQENGGVEEMIEEMHFHVYPNPTTGMVNIELPMTGTADVMITDVAGKVIYKQSIEDNTNPMLQYNLGSEAKGLYFIRVNVGGEVFTSKVTLQ